jgi:glycine dehydrogenase subunit 1
LSQTVHPQYRQVLSTYLRGAEAELAVTSMHDPDHVELRQQLDATTAACVIQSPNFFGQFEPVARLAEAAHEAGALVIVVPDPIALGLFRAPGQDGADLVAAEGQVLGIPLGFGGPHLGILAARGSLVRRLPGRLVGETVDRDGERGYVLTLGTREQHIRREKATSNICTNAALMALAAATYLATMGKSGLAVVARLCFHKSHYLAARIAEIDGCRVNPQSPETPFFKELVVELPVSAAEVNQRLLTDHDIVGGYDLGRDFEGLSNHLLLAVTEISTRPDLDRLVHGLREILGQGGEA